MTGDLVMEAANRLAGALMRETPRTTAINLGLRSRQIVNSGEHQRSVVELPKGMHARALQERMQGVASAVLVVHPLERPRLKRIVAAQGQFIVMAKKSAEDFTPRDVAYEVIMLRLGPRFYGWSPVEFLQAGGEHHDDATLLIEWGLEDMRFRSSLMAA